MSDEFDDEDFYDFDFDEDLDEDYDDYVDEEDLEIEDGEECFTCGGSGRQWTGYVWISCHTCGGTGRT